MNPWIWIVIGGFMEMVWASTMSLSDGFADVFWTVTTFLLSLVSVYFLDLGFKGGIPMGSGYAVWTGMGTVFSTVAGIFVFHDSLGILEFFFLAVLLGGIVLLQYFDGKSKETTD